MECHQKKYPNITKDRLALGYVSRKILNECKATPEGKKLLQDYFQNELGVQSGEQCIFVDIGFSGSMIPLFKEILSTDSNYHIDIEFEFLISLSPNAHGFIANYESPLPSVPFAGGNLAIHWLEDSHQGTLKSPTKLIQDRLTNRIYPNTKQPHHKNSYRDEAFEYVIRKFSQKAITQMSARDPQEIELSKSIEKLDALFVKIKNKEVPLYLKHL